MTCARCHGLLVSERDHIWAYIRCTSCGDRFDTMALQQRWLSRELNLLELELTHLRVPTHP